MNNAQRTEQIAMAPVRLALAAWRYWYESVGIVVGAVRALLEKNPAQKESK